MKWNVMLALLLTMASAMATDGRVEKLGDILPTSYWLKADDQQKLEYVKTARKGLGIVTVLNFFRSNKSYMECMDQTAKSRELDMMHGMRLAFLQCSS